MVFAQSMGQTDEGGEADIQCECWTSGVYTEFDCNWVRQELKQCDRVTIYISKGFKSREYIYIYIYIYI